MATLLNDVRDFFDGHRLKYTVSMFVRLNAQPDDGTDGFRAGFPERWFTLGPSDDQFTITLGTGGDVINTKDLSGEDVRPAIAEAIAFLAM
jgi:hypothetical protein